MKFAVVIATLACMLSASSASNYYKVENAHSEIMSYVAENLGGVRMMRSNRVHLECYNDFLPLVNSIALDAKKKSEMCVNGAEDKKNQTLANLDRTQIAAQVKLITDSLADCSAKEGLEYFICMESNAETNRQIMENVRTMALKVMNEKQSVIVNIDSDERNCIMSAVDFAKTQSDSAFGKLKSCITGDTTFNTSAAPKPRK